MAIDVESLIDLLDSRLIFTTADGEFEGILKLIMVKKQRVAFEHVYFLPSRKYMSTMHIQFSDFFSYKLKESHDTILDASKLDSLGQELVNGDLEKQLRVDDSVIVDDLNVYFYERLPSHLKNTCPSDYCIMESTCPAFFNAIDHISELTTIGVSLHGSELSRYGSLSWVCIATPGCLFMFDIDSVGIGAFDQGLRRIFEDEHIEKVVHDCREPADCLKHLFNTTLNNVFDTQVADYLINMQRYTDEAVFKYVSSLDNCIVKYLSLPQEFLYNRNKSVSKDAEIQFYKIRPICDEFRNVLIKSALYLLALKEKQQQLLLYPFHQAVDVYLNVLRDATEAEVFKTPNEFTQVAPRCLSECIKPVRFCNMLVLQEDTVSQFRQTPHGEEAWLKRKLMKKL